MIIFGTRGVATTKATGSFHCPSCGGRRNYQHKRLRRFFTLYFIPVVPMDLLHEYVQCETCRGDFRMGVLQYDPEIERRARQEGVNAHYRAVVVHFARMANRSDPEFLDRVAQLIGSFAGGAVAGDDVAADLRQEPLDIIPAAERLGAALSERGREELMFSLVEVTGPLDESRRQALVEAGRALGMSEAHVRGVLAA